MFQGVLHIHISKELDVDLIVTVAIFQTRSRLTYHVNRITLK